MILKSADVSVNTLTVSHICAAGRGALFFPRAIGKYWKTLYNHKRILRFNGELTSRILFNAEGQPFCVFFIIFPSLILSTVSWHVLCFIKQDLRSWQTLPFLIHSAIRVNFVRDCFLNPRKSTDCECILKSNVCQMQISSLIGNRSDTCRVPNAQTPR